ncbi:MAG: sigma-70 family RNA polymerase sigma factor [Dechloromonas sp.]|nr:sigma-70 family RNA polymerase sigma factor [Dechloromonas sp.]
MSQPCLMAAWSACQAELLGYLRHRVGHPEDAEEVLQEVFIKAMRQGEQFCGVDNPRAWLFQVARNALADRLRVSRDHLALPDDLATPVPDGPLPVDDLSQCLPRVLSELSAADRLVVTFCDIEGGSQQALADRLGLTLSGAKSRLQRARKRLKARMEQGCRVLYDESGKVAGFTPRPPLAE